MSAVEFSYIQTVLGSFGLGALIAGAIVYFLTKAYFLKYIEEKAKNRATIEDTETITRIVEQVKATFTSQERLRFAAMDRRLQAHQEAYGLSRRLVVDVQATDASNLVITLEECSKWFNANALYLEPEARDAFWKCWFTANVYKMYEHRSGPERRENWEKIVGAQDVIASCVGLPKLVQDSLGAVAREITS